jgi:hypothetical protein
MSARPLVNLVALFLGTAILGSGVHGVLSPFEASRTFGIVNVTKDMSPFFAGLAGRNVGGGLAIWSLFLTGHRKALGILLLSWSVVGWSDIYLLLNHDGPVESIGRHVFGTALLLLVGPALIMGN